MNVADKTYDPTPARRIACIGLGTMGAPMAAHLQPGAAPPLSGGALPAAASRGERRRALHRGVATPGVPTSRPSDSLPTGATGALPSIHLSLLP